MAVFSAWNWKAFVVHALCLSCVAAVRYSNETSFDGGKYILSWFYNANDDSLYLKAVVEATGWVGLGFSDQNTGMKNLDVAIGGVSGGTGYLKDYYANSMSAPTEDGQQSYKLLQSSESAGKTTIEISRKRDTADAKDMQFTAGKEVYFAWAYHSSNDANAALTDRHSKRGYSSAKLVFVPVTPTAATSVGSTEMGPQATQAPASQSVGPQSTLVPTSQPTRSNVTEAPTSNGSRVLASSLVFCCSFVFHSACSSV